MSRSAPYFSVITPSFNQARWLEGCIKSVVAQGVADFEHIVFDNASGDGSAEIAARYPHVLWRSEPDRGQAHALNKALAVARGEIVCWLNADDQYLPGAFEIVRRAFAAPEVEVVFGDAREIYFDGRPGGVRRAHFERREDFLFWWEKRTDLLQPAVFFRRSVVARAGPFREDLHLIMDSEMWWRLSAQHRFHYLAQPLALQQRQPDSKTVKHLERIYEEKARVFGPLLAAAWPHRRFRHWLARRRGMGRRYLGLAQSAGGADRALALRFLRRSADENPFLLCALRWWKAALFILRSKPKPVSSDPEPRLPVTAPSDR
jgi:glycosyltransferase involved in cell wall biosynthesis